MRYVVLVSSWLLGQEVEAAAAGDIDSRRWITDTRLQPAKSAGGRSGRGVGVALQLTGRIIERFVDVQRGRCGAAQRRHSNGGQRGARAPFRACIAKSKGRP